jgi:hypothetical protein
MSVRSILGLEERGVGNSDRNNLTDDTAVEEEQEGLGIIDGLIGGRDEPAEVDETREFPRREWILLVLYARDASGERAPVRGDFTLSLALFLLRRNFEAYFDVTLPFEFESSELGPRDEESLSTLEQLCTEGLIDRRQSTDSEYPLDDHVYEITDEGRSEVEAVYERLTENEQNELRRIKSQSTLGDLGDLITSAYRKGSNLFEGNLVRR